MSNRLKTLFLITDIGLIAYWLITLLHLIPTAYLFNDYTNPILVAWNWSFLPLDLLISATGLTSVALDRARDPAWRAWAMSSLALTFTSGLQAIAFWGIRSDFDVLWWAANGYLLMYPLLFIPRLIGASNTKHDRAQSRSAQTT